LNQNLAELNSDYSDRLLGGLIAWRRRKMRLRNL
jgi:hypothetical protein